MRSTKRTGRSPPGSISRAPTRASSTRKRSDVLLGKLTKRSVDVRALKFGNVEKISGDKIKQVATLRVGIEQELAKNIVKQIKDSKLKVQASIQGDAVRVSGAKRDELQNAIALVKKTITDFPVQFGNFRD